MVNMSDCVLKRLVKISTKILLAQLKPSSAYLNK